MFKSYKYRLYPNKAQTEKLQWILDRCRELYNAALQERREAWKYAKKSISCFDQYQQIPAIREVRPEYNDVPVIVLRSALMRVDRAMKAFFRRCKQDKPEVYAHGNGENDALGNLLKLLAEVPPDPFLTDQSQSVTFEEWKESKEV